MLEQDFAGEGQAVRENARRSGVGRRAVLNGDAPAL